MHTKLYSARVVRYALLLALSLSCADSMAGISRYEQPQASVSNNSLWVKVSAWLRELPLLANDETRGFHWVETSKVVDDPRQDMRMMGKQHALSYQRVIAPAGMFRRIESGPHSSVNGVQLRQHVNAAIPAEQNLMLSANIPPGILVADTEIIWRVRPLDAGSERQLVGQGIGLSLPDGKYAISLLIGAYEEHTVVEVMHGRQVAPVFATHIGRLQANGERLAGWDVFLMQGQTPLRKVLSHGGTYQLNEIVAAGEYDVVATIGDARQRARVRVGQGETAVARLEIPTGRINLVATLGNTPAMRQMGWKVFRLDGGRREVAAPRRHSATLVVPPGHYEAIATLDGKERRREFTVTDGTDNSIVLAMD
jgi:hypothetical protein